MLSGGAVALQIPPSGRPQRLAVRSLSQWLPSQFRLGPIPRHLLDPRDSAETASFDTLSFGLEAFLDLIKVGSPRMDPQ